MKKLITKTVLGLGVMATVGSQLKAYCFYLHSDTPVTVYVVRSRDDFYKLKFPPDLYHGGNMEPRGIYLGRGSKILSTLGGSSRIKAVHKLTHKPSNKKPLSNLFRVNPKFDRSKAKTNSSNKKPPHACWGWGSVQKQLKLPPGSRLFAFVIDHENSKYLGDFEFDARGYVRLKVINGKLEAAIIKHDEENPEYPYKLSWKTPGMDVGL